MAAAQRNPGSPHCGEHIQYVSTCTSEETRSRRESNRKTQRTAGGAVRDDLPMVACGPRRRERGRNGRRANQRAPMPPPVSGPPPRLSAADHAHARSFSHRYPRVVHAPRTPANPTRPHAGRPCPRAARALVRAPGRAGRIRPAGGRGSGRQRRAHVARGRGARRRRRPHAHVTPEITSGKGNHDLPVPAQRTHSPGKAGHGHRTIAPYAHTDGRCERSIRPTTHHPLLPLPAAALPCRAAAPD